VKDISSPVNQSPSFAIDGGVMTLGNYEAIYLTKNERAKHVTCTFKYMLHDVKKPRVWPESMFKFSSLKSIPPLRSKFV
jgi:hypothetical protein